MTNTKKTILFIHRWLGFISGLAVFIVSITGCIYCFQDDIQDILYDYRTVEPVSKAFVIPSKLIDLAHVRYPEGKITSVIYYGPARSVQVRITVKKKAMSLFYNPYSANFLHEQVLKDNFFAFIKEAHLYLFLPKEIGKMVNGVSVITFVIIMISGIVLWWPKRKSDRKRSFTIKWNSKWKRVNYDLHNVLGFYATAIAILLAITGLSYSFQWVSKGIYNIANVVSNVPNEKRSFKSDSVNAVLYPDSALSINKAYQQVIHNSPKANYLLMVLASKPGSVISVTAYPKPLHFSYSDNYAFDKYSGKMLNFLPFQEKSNGLKINNMNYDIHTGQIMGIPGKIIAFLASLISATLPVTGLIIYLGKKGKKKRKQVASPGKPMDMKSKDVS